MTRRLFGLGVLAAAFGLMLAAAPARAHHSLAAGFDMNKPVTLVGTIVRMEWRNPHAWLHIEVRDASGQVQPWSIEFGSANALYRRGWRRDDLPVGATVTVSGYLSRDGSRSASATDVKLPDGRTLFAGTGR